MSWLSVRLLQTVTMERWQCVLPASVALSQVLYCTAAVPGQVKSSSAESPFTAAPAPNQFTNCNTNSRGGSAATGAGQAQARQMVQLLQVPNCTAWRHNFAARTVVVWAQSRVCSLPGRAQLCDCSLKRSKYYNNHNQFMSVSARLATQATLLSTHTTPPNHQRRAPPSL